MQESRLKGGWTHTKQSEFLRLFAGSPEALRALLGSDYPSEVRGSAEEVRFAGPADVARHGLTRDQAGAGENEITIVRADDGTYVVHLPGVADLRDGLTSGAISGAAARNPLVGGASALGVWNGPNSDDSPRDMRWGTESARSGELSTGSSWTNPYAASVRLALQAAGAPHGASVILTGHSFGAYTAMELALDTSFNTTDDSGYRVTSVLAMAADVDWRMDDNMPAHTSGLVINNTNDQVFRAEAALGRNPVESNVPENWREVEFAGGLGDVGHGLPNYESWIRVNGDRLPAEFSGITSGTSTQYVVHDIYR